MPDDFATLLRREAAQYARELAPRPAHEIRARGDRRRRAAGASAVLALILLTGGGGAAYALSQHSGPSVPVTPVASRPPSATPSAPPGTPTTGPRVSRSPAQPAAAGPGIVAVTTAGSVEMIDPATGAVTRTLVAGGAFGDEISVSGGKVYYAARRGCSSEIYAVPLAGGPPAAIVAGAQPAVSPDGTRLAYMREPYASGGQPVYQSCGLPASGTPAVSLVIRNLASGAETVYRKPPAVLRSPLVYPVSHLSWAPDGSRLLLSMGAVSSGTGQALVMLDPTRTIYYVPGNYLAGGGRVPGPGGQGAYYREAVFMPDGNLLVNVICGPQGCGPSNARLEEVTPAGTPVRQLVPIMAGQDHSSLAASGPWVLFLSGTDLYVFRNGRPPAHVAAGLAAAAWAGVG